MTFYSFIEMPVWQLGQQIVKEVYDLTEPLPRKEDHALASQLRDAALSIPGNIAEGFGRYHRKEKINFYLYSRGSSCEVMSHLHSGLIVNYFKEESVMAVCEKCKTVNEGLNKMIKALSSHPPKPQPKP